MDKLREALQALDAVDLTMQRGAERRGSSTGYADGWHDCLRRVKSELRAALAEPVADEPVAWIEHEWDGTGQRRLHFERRAASVRDEVVNPIWTPLYIRPTPAPSERVFVPDDRNAYADVARAYVGADRAQRVPLPADDEKPHAVNVPGYGYVDVNAARAIERAHGIGAKP